MRSAAVTRAAILLAPALAVAGLADPHGVADSDLDVLLAKPGTVGDAVDGPSSREGPPLRGDVAWTRY